MADIDDDELGRPRLKRPVRIVDAMITTNEAGQPVPVIPIRVVAGDADEDAAGNPVSVMPIEVVDALLTLDETGKAISVLPVRQVDALVGTDEVGRPVDVIPVKGTIGPPAAPSAFTVGRWALARNAVSGQLAVTINSLPSSNGSAITDIEYRIDGGSWVSSGGITSFVIGSLTNGTEYDVELRAVNAIGNGDAGDLKSATPATYPAAPSVTLTPGDGQVSIAWTDGAANGLAITSHKLYWSTSSGVTSADYAGDIMTGSPYVLSGLTNDTPIYVKLAAVNGVGTGTLSTEKSATPAVAAADPAAITADADSFDVTDPEIGSSWEWRLLEPGATPSPSDPAISGEVATSLALDAIEVGQGAYVVPDGNWSRHSNVRYRLVAIPEPDTTHHAASGAANGTTLPNVGWTRTSARDNLQVQSNKWCYTENYPFEGGWYKTLSSPDQEVGFAQYIPSGYATDGDATSFNLRVSYTDSSNYIRAEGSSANGTHIYARIGGSDTDLTPGAYVLHHGSGVLSLKRVGTRVYFLVDGEVYPQSPSNPRTTGDNGLDISDLAGSLPASNKVQIQNLGFNYSVQPFAVATDIFTSAYPEAAMQISSAEFTEPTLANNYVNLELQGTGAGVSNYMLGWWLDGQPVAVSGPYALTAGAFDTLNIETPDEVQGTSAQIIIWDESDPTTFGYLTVAPPTYPLLNAAIPGHQFGDVAIWSEESYAYRERQYFARWTCYTTADGWVPPNPDGSLPGDATFFRLIVMEGAKLGYGMDTQWTATWAGVAGFTVAAGSVENCTTYSVNSAGRSATVTPTAGTRPFFSMDFTPTAGQSVPMDISSAFVITRDADTATGPISDLALDAFIEGSIFRAMKAGAVEAPYVVDPEAPGGLVTPPNALPARIAAIYLQTGTMPHLCMPCNATADYVTWWATEFLAIIPEGIELIIEAFNEYENIVYAANLSATHTRACSKGFVDGAPAADYLNCAADQNAENWDFTLDTHQSKIFIPANTYFYANVGTFAAYKAITDINIGDVLPGTTNGQVDVLVHDNDTMMAGGRRSQLDDVQQWKAIFVSVAAGRNPIKSYWATWYYTIAELTDDALAYVPADREDVMENALGYGLDLAGCSHYTDTKYYWGTAPSAVTGFASDQAALNAWVASEFIDKGEQALAVIKAQWQGWYNRRKADGWPTDKIPTGYTYEGHFNLDVLDVPDIYWKRDDPGFVASFADAVQTAYLQTGMYDAQLAYQQGLTALGLYGFVNFQMHQRIDDGSEVRTWQFLRRVNSMNDPDAAVDQNWKAYADHCAAVLP